MKRCALATAILALTLTMGTDATEPALTFTKLWTHGHETPGQISEIPAFDRRTNTIWVAGVVGVDVLDAATGDLVEHIDVTDYGFVNSVAIHNGLAALAVESPGDRRNAGMVLFYDTDTLSLSDGVNVVPVGALPDMLTFTHDGSKLLVANEGTPNPVADTPYAAPDPLGSVSIIDMETRTVVATAGFAGVPDRGQQPAHQHRDGLRARVHRGDPGRHPGLRHPAGSQRHRGARPDDQPVHEGDRSRRQGLQPGPGNEIDPRDDGSVNFIAVAAKGLYMPDGVAVYRVAG